MHRWHSGITTQIRAKRLDVGDGAHARSPGYRHDEGAATQLEGSSAIISGMRTGRHRCSGNHDHLPQPSRGFESLPLRLVRDAREFSLRAREFGFPIRRPAERGRCSCFEIRARGSTHEVHELTEVEISSVAGASAAFREMLGQESKVACKHPDSAVIPPDRMEPVTEPARAGPGKVVAPARRTGRAGALDTTSSNTSPRAMRCIQRIGVIVGSPSISACRSFMPIDSQQRNYFETGLKSDSRPYTRRGGSDPAH
jgi:hypothetical protein